MMSRSRKKSLHMPNGGSSEAEDKKLWHGRMRAAERVEMAAAARQKRLGEHLPVAEEQVSDPWDMTKDGRQYWAMDSRKKIAERFATAKGKTDQERASLALRLMHKWIGK